MAGQQGESGMKVAELEGALLDAWVAQAEGGYDVVPAPTDPQGCWVSSGGDPFPFRPSTDWLQGGPIIERQEITVVGSESWLGKWRAAANVIWLPDHYEWHYGPTPLIAAMRAYVASKFGYEVPDSYPKPLDFQQDKQ